MTFWETALIGVHLSADTVHTVHFMVLEVVIVQLTTKHRSYWDFLCSFLYFFAFLCCWVFIVKWTFLPVSIQCGRFMRKLGEVFINTPTRQIQAFTTRSWLVKSGQITNFLCYFTLFCAEKTPILVIKHAYTNTSTHKMRVFATRFCLVKCGRITF